MDTFLSRSPTFAELQEVFESSKTNVRFHQTSFTAWREHLFLRFPMAMCSRSLQCTAGRVSQNGVEPLFNYGSIEDELEGSPQATGHRRAITDNRIRHEIGPLVPESPSIPSLHYSTLRSKASGPLSQPLLKYLHWKRLNQRKAGTAETGESQGPELPA